MSGQPPWVNRTPKSWGLAHCLRPNTGFSFRDSRHVRTLCGRVVQADQIVAAGRENRCRLCERRRAQHRDTEEN